ncbi:MAG: S1 RNA-binding domain-containing protein [Synergistes sp.]|nr:S1 RNA-binding domain-containing protein [Synergistes sp.]
MVDELHNVEGEVKETPEKEEKMTEEMVEQYGGKAGDFRRGKVVEGKIIDVLDEGWLVDIGYKSEGFLARKDWTNKALVEDQGEPEKGATIRVQIVTLGTGEDAQPTLSRWRCEFDDRWAKLEKEVEEHDTVRVKGLRKVKGGLIVACCGIEGFIPVSHLTSEGHGGNPGKLVDQEFDAKLLEKDRRKHRVVFSRRSILEEELAGIRKEFYEHVHEGDILEGEVSSITAFGIFVNLGAMEGLVHISELSWQKTPKLKDFSKGDHVKVKVIGIDTERNKISLSIRQTEENPWDRAVETLSAGMVMEGAITNLTEFGVFVELLPGVEGLVHVGELSWTRVKHPKEVVKKGQKLTVIITEIDKDRKRISLGYKQLNDPWKDAAERYPKNSEVTAKVVRLADFGAFVEVEPGIEGLIHISQISSERIEKPKDVLTEGQEVTARVVEVNAEEHKMRLSMRPPREERREARPREERHERQPEPEMRERRDDRPTLRQERPRRRRPEGHERRYQESQNSPYPQEEMRFSIGDFMKQHEEE